jgi:hypothetical protein
LPLPAAYLIRMLGSDWGASRNSTSPCWQPLRFIFIFVSRSNSKLTDISRGDASPRLVSLSAQILNVQIHDARYEVTHTRLFYLILSDRVLIRISDSIQTRRSKTRSRKAYS